MNMQMLVLESTKEPIELGKSYTIVKGVRAKLKDENKVTVTKIIKPTKENPRGLLHTGTNKDSGIESWSEYYPDVIGAIWIDVDIGFDKGTEFDITVNKNIKVE